MPIESGAGHGKVLWAVSWLALPLNGVWGTNQESAAKGKAVGCWQAITTPNWWWGGAIGDRYGWGEGLWAHFGGGG